MRRLLVLLSVFVLASAAGACGSDVTADPDGKKASAAEIVKRTAAAMDGVKSYKGEIELRSDLGGEKLQLEGRTVSAMDESRGRVKGRFAQGKDELKGIEVLVFGQENFVRGEIVEAALLPGQKWLKVEDDAPASMSVPEFLEFLKKTKQVKVVGSEDVGGVPTSHLRGPLDLEELARSTSSEAAKRFGRLKGADQLESTLDVWISQEDDRLRRMAFELTGPEGAGALVTTIEIQKYDVSLDGLRKPPASTVVASD